MYYSWHVTDSCLEDCVITPPASRLSGAPSVFCAQWCALTRCKGVIAAWELWELTCSAWCVQALLWKMNYHCLSCWCVEEGVAGFTSPEPSILRSRVKTLMKGWFSEGWTRVRVTLDFCHLETSNNRKPWSLLGPKVQSKERLSVEWSQRAVEQENGTGGIGAWSKSASQLREGQEKAGLPSPASFPSPLISFRCLLCPNPPGTLPASSLVIAVEVSLLGHRERAQRAGRLLCRWKGDQTKSLPKLVTCPWSHFDHFISSSSSPEIPK